MDARIAERSFENILAYVRIMSKVFYFSYWRRQNMSTTLAKKETVERKWYVIDAAGKPLGRVAVQAATLLRGKHKPTFTPNVDCGDFVIVINAAKAELTG